VDGGSGRRAPQRSDFEQIADFEQRSDCELRVPVTDHASGPDAALLGFSCPRCAADVEEAFYGPCRECREDLVATQGKQASGATSTAPTSRFEPEMHVVPNHVATKD